VLRPRIIPCLLVTKAGLVKTCEFREPKYVGDPINAVKIFNEKEADELVVLDIEATALGVAPNYRLIGQIAAECRMPLCYGGGIRSMEQAKFIIGLGVEKVAISSGAVENPALIASIANEIGSQSVVVVLDVNNSGSDQEYRVWTHNGRVNTGRCAIEFAREAESFGAGEIVVNSIARDGHMNGYDLALARKIIDSVRVPVSVLGGAGSLSDIESLVRTCGIVGAMAGSLFVFKGTYRAVLINYPDGAQKASIVGLSVGRSVA
jgi:cyclase